MYPAYASCKLRKFIFFVQISKWNVNSIAFKCLTSGNEVDETSDSRCYSRWGWRLLLWGWMEVKWNQLRPALSSLEPVGGCRLEVWSRLEVNWDKRKELSLICSQPSPPSSLLICSPNSQESHHQPGLARNPPTTNITACSLANKIKISHKRQISVLKL